MRALANSKHGVVQTFPREASTGDAGVVRLRVPVKRLTGAAGRGGGAAGSCNLPRCRGR